MCTYYTSENAFYIGGKRKRNMHTAQRRRNTDSILEIVHIRVSLSLNQLQFQPRFGLGSGLAGFKRDFNLDTTLRSRTILIWGICLERLSFAPTKAVWFRLGKTTKTVLYRTDGDKAGVHASFQCLLRLFGPLLEDNFVLA